MSMKKAVTIVEIMGRDAGWLTASSALARRYEGDNPFLIYLPEVDFDVEKFLKDVENSFQKSAASSSVYPRESTMPLES